ncbi:hypothetical protein PVAP13_3KG161827 [Panicum virgatum]|uniref:Uncharacterized protein n=1 Tax=Panicum virgatum TaxID=38727 RepID=A0A8T0UQR3_PANVG|nr:hypothetical protein PVAP13_3KG161827 [Panicum virgatum]
MRQCFALCAMFPKDYEIDVEMLIQLWMANGFIPEQQGEEHPEISGKNIFIELASRSFFQNVKGIPFEFTDAGISRVTCMIHDLMHDVALDSMGKECAAVAAQPSQSEDFPYSARHLLLSVNEPDTFLNASLEKGSSVIQTLICEKKVDKDLQHLSKYSSARALTLELWSKRASLLKPKCLHHLRYLDLSKSDISSLPEDISILYHLQTLNLSYCRSLKRLPKGMKYMTALRHLYTHECWNLKGMPTDLRYLTSLQTLTCFVAGAGSGCSKVGELRRLDDLGGQLELTQLENVKEADAYAGNLENKKKLARLTLRWTDNDKEAQNCDKEVLEGLKPHGGLKVLRIYSYNGDTCPTWMSELQGIVELVLSDCKKLQKVPAIWQLPALKVLCLYRLPNCETWWDKRGTRRKSSISFA